MSVTIPSTITLDIPLDVDLDVTAGVTAALQAAVTADLNAQVGADLNANVNGAGALTMTLLGDPSKPVSAVIDGNIFLKNLPVFTFDDIQKLIDDLKPRMRIRLPFQFKFGLSVFPLNLWGVDALQMSFCGEPQLIIQDYVPNAYERCEVECQPCGG